MVGGEDFRLCELVAEARRLQLWPGGHFPLSYKVDKRTSLLLRSHGVVWMHTGLTGTGEGTVGQLPRPKSFPQLFSSRFLK